jgi:hypothetical protein
MKDEYKFKESISSEGFDSTIIEQAYLLVKSINV